MAWSARWAATALAVSTVVGACHQRGQRPETRDAAVTPAPQGGADAAAALAGPVDPEADAELVVGSGRGLEGWRRDGRGKRLISRGAALHPRWLDRNTVLVLHPTQEGDITQGARLERISVRDGKRSKVAVLPPFACAAPNRGEGAEIGSPLDLQSASDFVVDESGVACLTLMDRNSNMAERILRVRANLRTGKVSRTLEDLAGDCVPPRDVEVGGGGACGAASGVAPPEPTRTYPFAFEDGAVRGLAAVRAEAPAAIRLAGYEGEAASASGRWQVLGGDKEEGDYVHRQLVLFDRETGHLFPIRPRGGPWPSPLRPASAKAGAVSVRTPIKGTVGAVAETDLRWLGDTASSEVLVIDDLVVRPGGAALLVKGEVAR